MPPVPSKVLHVSVISQYNSQHFDSHLFDMLLKGTVCRCYVHFLICHSLCNLLDPVSKVISELQIQWSLLSSLRMLSLQVMLLTDTCSSFSFHSSLLWVSFYPSDQHSGIFCLNHISLCYFSYLPPAAGDYQSSGPCLVFSSNTVFCKDFIHLHGFTLLREKSPNLQAQFWPHYWASDF